jgi:hypothetical protein
MGRQAKLKRQRKQAIQQEADAELNSETAATAATDRDPSTTSPESKSADAATSADPHNVPITRDFLNKMERQGYSLKADIRAPEITDERPQPQRR